MATLPKILIIDDNKFILNALTGMIQEEIEVEILTATTFEETKKNFEEHGSSIVLAIVDLNLPDCEDGEAAKLSITNSIPTIILTGSVNTPLKELQKNDVVLEFVLKNSTNSLPYIIKLVKKLINNLQASVLIVDDSDLQLSIVTANLELINITNIFTAKDGVEALKIVEEKHDQLSMIITDFEMPNMNGLELVQSVREKYFKDKLSIIALSASENSSLASEFLKIGANDYITKPFDTKEFQTRVNNNLEICWLFQENERQKKKLHEYAFTDLETKINNKAKYFIMIKRYCQRFQKAKYIKNGQGLYQITIEIEGLKEINKKHGYLIGDKMLKSFVGIVTPMIGEKDSIYRVSSSVFVIILPKNKLDIVQKLRTTIIEKLEERTKSALVEYKVSITQYNPKSTVNEFVSGIF